MRLLNDLSPEPVHGRDGRPLVYRQSLGLKARPLFLLVLLGDLRRVCARSGRVRERDGPR
jgi:hypothetical protein